MVKVKPAHDQLATTCSCSINFNDQTELQSQGSSYVILFSHSSVSHNMHRYSPVRNQRSKGIKIKHVLRICLSIGVCCWLIFQIKRSHYKQKDLESTDTKTLTSTTNVDEALIFGRKGLQPKETETREEEEEEHEVVEEKDDETDEDEQYKFDNEEEAVNESDEKDGQSQTAREEHYKADDASSAVTHKLEDQTLNNTKFLEMGITEHETQVHNGAKIQETVSKSANVSFDRGQNVSVITRVIESETSLKSTSMSAETMLTTKENNSGFSNTETETEDPDEVQHDGIDSTDLEDPDNSEDTISE